MSLVTHWNTLIQIFFLFCHIDYTFLRCHRTYSIEEETFWWQSLKRHGDVHISHLCHLYNQMTRAEHRLWLAVIWGPCGKGSGLQTLWCCRLDNVLVFRKQETSGSLWGRLLCSKTKGKRFSIRKILSMPRSGTHEVCLDSDLSKSTSPKTRVWDSFINNTTK